MLWGRIGQGGGNESGGNEGGRKEPPGMSKAVNTSLSESVGLIIHMNPCKEKRPVIQIMTAIPVRWCRPPRLANEEIHAQI